MGDDISDLKGLTVLSGLSFRAAQARMAALLEREARLRRNLLQLTESRSAQAQASRAPDEAALVAGADIRWHHWVDQRRAVINTELAQVLALQENCRAALKEAFGREQAAQSLFERAAREGSRKRKRQENYES
ncbi:hypothetical protein [Yoonia sp. BS5-3]|uniref:Flagellar FliJ protein n=1 Tax=Yoonia phaeophyticola TaxID=3137369 RepID=A0ABZ2V7X3_9RHOB